MTKGCLVPSVQRIGCASMLALYKLMESFGCRLLIAANAGARAFLGQRALYKCTACNLVTVHPLEHLTQHPDDARRLHLRPHLPQLRQKICGLGQPLASGPSSDALIKTHNCAGLVSSCIIRRWAPKK